VVIFSLSLLFGGTGCLWTNPLREDTMQVSLLDLVLVALVALMFVYTWFCRSWVLADARDMDMAGGYTRWRGDMDTFKIHERSVAKVRFWSVFTHKKLKKSGIFWAFFPHKLEELPTSGPDVCTEDEYVGWLEAWVHIPHFGMYKRALLARAVVLSGVVVYYSFTFLS